jgi:hypothetical protein
MPRRTGVDPRQIEVIDDVMAEVLRRKSGAERLQIASAMHGSARKTLTHYLASQNPDWNSEKLTREVARRLLHGSK